MHQHEICDDICRCAGASPTSANLPGFSISSGSICGESYCTPAGWDAIGYVGNVAFLNLKGLPERCWKSLG